MLYATHQGRTIEASREIRRAKCPVCGSDVIAKCGEKRLMVWHWAHKAKLDCDPWSEPESNWHKNWKELFPPEWREVAMENHRADIKTPLCVIEFQHSSISASEIEEREVFYGKMLWVFDFRKIKDSFSMPDGQTGEFKWARYRKSLAHCRKPVFIQLEKGYVWHIWGFDVEAKVGYAKRYDKDSFLSLVGLFGEHSILPDQEFLDQEKLNQYCERIAREKEVKEKKKEHDLSEYIKRKNSYLEYEQSIQGSVEAAGKHIRGGVAKTAFKLDAKGRIIRD